MVPTAANAIRISWSFSGHVVISLWPCISMQIPAVVTFLILQVRAKRLEMTYEEYEFEYLPTIRQRAEALVKKVIIS
jgi:hypothetical protein